MPDTFGYPQQTPQSPSTGLFHDRERPIRRPLAHRLDEFPAGYSSADCSPAGSASASPTVDHFALMSSRRSILFCRTVNSVLTVCLSSGDQPILSDRLLTSEFRILSFRTEWQPIVTQLINETTSCLRAMVIDRELTRWWNSLPGQAYMIANLNLLKAGRTIKRLFILLSRERHIVDNTLLT